MSKRKARELLDQMQHTIDFELVGELSARVEAVLAVHVRGGGWACELCQTHLPCLTQRLLNGEDV